MTEKMKINKIKGGLKIAAIAFCASLALSSCAELLSTSAPQKKKTTTSTTVTSSSSTSSSSSQSTSSTTVGQAKADGTTSKGRSSVTK